MLTLGSLFDGIGGFPLAGIQYGIQPLWASEIEKFPIRVTEARLPFMRHVGDITALKGSDVEPVDILTGGFPCQDLSLAGLRAGLAGSRSGLWQHFHRLIAELQPTWVIIENVPGLLSSQRGRDMGTIIRALEQLGYGCAWRVLDAQYAGVPQRRRRVIIVGHSGGSWGPPAQVLLEPDGLCWDTPTRRQAGEAVAGTLGGGSGNRGWASDTERMTFLPFAFAENGRAELRTMEVMPSLTVGGGKPGQGYPAVAHALTAEGFDASEDGTGRGTPLVAFDSKSAFHPHGEDVTPTLRAMNSAVGHHNSGGQLPQAYSVRGREGGAQIEGGADVSPALRTPGGGSSHPLILSGEPTPLLEVGARTGASTDDPRAGIGIGSPGDPMYTLQATKQHGLLDRLMVRRLTPLECERLQGFPDGWTAVPDAKGKPAADGPRYRALGNAIAVPVFAWVLGNIAAYEAAIIERVAA